MSGRPRTLEFWRERRGHLLSAARAELVDVGIEGLTLEGVARRSSRSKGALQYAFGSKGQLLEELAGDTLFSLVADGLAPASDEQSVSLEALVDALTAAFACDEERLVALVALLSTARRNEGTRKAFEAFHASADDRIGRVLREAGMTADDAELQMLVRGVRGVLVGMFTQWVVDPQHRTLDVAADEARSTLGLLLRPLTERAASTTPAGPPCSDAASR